MFFLGVHSVFSQSKSGLRYGYIMEMGVHKFNCIEKNVIYYFENPYDVNSNQLINSSDYKIDTYTSLEELSKSLQRLNDAIDNKAKLYISVGENSQRGYVSLTYTPAKNYIYPKVPTGNITIYTNEGSKIQCTDRKLRSLQIINGEHMGTSLYYLTFSELKKIASEGISQMYFSLGDEYEIELDRYGITDLNFYFQD